LKQALRRSTKYCIGPRWSLPLIKSLFGLSEIYCCISAQARRPYTSADATSKAAQKKFSEWTSKHTRAFEAIKGLVVSHECLTTINHEDPSDNKIFVTCDASEWRTGAMLSFGPTWESACPVAFDSMQLHDTKKNYPIHEKELLAIIHALKKWRADLLGSPIHIYTDHRMLENFNTQKELSRRQLGWQEYMSQYKMTITYIKGEDNCVTDALSRVAPDAFSDEDGYKGSHIGGVKDGWAFGRSDYIDRPSYRYSTYLGVREVRLY
jgi:hypothetical protein